MSNEEYEIGVKCQCGEQYCTIFNPDTVDEQYKMLDHYAKKHELVCPHTMRYTKVRK